LLSNGTPNLSFESTPTTQLTDFFQAENFWTKEFFDGSRVAQGCQIFVGTKYQNAKIYTKLPQNILNVYKMDQMSNTFHCKTLQNLPKLGFWVRKHLATLASPLSKGSRHFCLFQD
jgi:hypothetical protein